MNYKYLIRALWCSALVLTVAGCGTPTGPHSDFASARQRWEARAPASYSYTVYRGCFCPTEWSGPVAVVVRNGVVESQRYTRTGLEVPAKYAHLFPTIEELFQIALTTRAPDGGKVTLTFDEIYGYPTAIDVRPIVADDIVTYSASLLMPL